MGIFPIGGQRIGIVTDVPVLDGDGKPVVSDLMEPVTVEAVVWWDGCVLEMQTISETQGDTVTTSEVAVVCGPVVDGHIPAVDDDGDPAPMTVSDLDSGCKLREGDETFVMRADAVLQKDIRGREDHVECRCEREGG